MEKNDVNIEFVDPRKEDGGKEMEIADTKEAEIITAAPKKKRTAKKTGIITGLKQPVRVYCTGCVYFHRQSMQKTSGECHRDPPRENGFPKVRATDWCGYGRSAQ